MDMKEVIDRLKRIVELNSYYLRQQANSRNKTMISEAIEELKKLQDETVDIFKSYEILKIIYPDRNENFHNEWYKDLYGYGLNTDVNYAIVILAKNLEEKQEEDEKEQEEQEDQK